jgi:hypothetical protein
MSDAKDLQQRRETLETELSGLREQRERAFRANSDALSLQRYGVTDHNAAKMEQFADDETAGDSAMTERRREIEQIDDELARDHRVGLKGRAGRFMKRLRK